MSIKNRLLKSGMTPDTAHFMNAPHSHNLNWDVTLSYWASRDCRDWRGDRCPCGTLPLKILAGIKPKRIPLQVKVMSYKLAGTQRIQYSGRKRPHCRLKNFVCIGPEVNGLSYPLLHQCNQENLLHHKNWSTPEICKTKHVSIFFPLNSIHHKALKSIPLSEGERPNDSDQEHTTLPTACSSHWYRVCSIPADQKNTNTTHIKLTPKHTALWCWILWCWILCFDNANRAEEAAKS